MHAGLAISADLASGALCGAGLPAPGKPAWVYAPEADDTLAPPAAPPIAAGLVTPVVDSEQGALRDDGDIGEERQESVARRRSSCCASCSRSACKNVSSPTSSTIGTS